VSYERVKGGRKEQNERRIGKGEGEEEGLEDSTEK
jgi:hypothetical protein